jgi:tetratricopeptide (TPR) repeat protein
MARATSGMPLLRSNIDSVYGHGREHATQAHTLYKRAMKLANNEIPLDQPLATPGLWARLKLRRALSLLAEVIMLAPDNYAANWFAGKIHQRFGEHREALQFFRRAVELNPTQPDVLREASISAADTEAIDEAVAFARRAVSVEPENPGLHANLALALLLAGRVGEAVDEIHTAAKADPADTITATLVKVINHFHASGAQPPKTLSALKRVAARLK